MSDFLGTLCNTRLLRAALKNAELPALELAQEKLKEIVAEHRREEEERKLNAAKKMEVINSIKSIMNNNNLSLNDLGLILAGHEPVEKRPSRRNVPAKYKFTDAEGKEYTWTGQGRTPVAFTECMARENKTKQDYLIQKEEP